MTSAVKFHLAQIEVRDFRGIAHLDLPLPKGMPLYLVGANNAGKTTVLDAIALALRAGGFHTFTPEPFDFRLGPDGHHSAEFSITLRFEADGGKLPAVKGIEAPTFVHGVRVCGKETKRGYEHSHNLIDATGEKITFSPASPVPKALKEEFAGTGATYRKVNARLDDIRDHLPEVWALRPDEIEASLYVWRTGPLRRLASLLSKHLLADKWAYRERPMPEAIKSAHAFLRGAVQELPFWKDNLRPKLEEALGRYVGAPARFDLSPDLMALEEWLVSQLGIAFAIEDGSTPVPLKNMGDGWQSLVRLAALDVFRQYPELVRGQGTLLLLEEPETHLHPHLRRKLRDVLEDLASNGWQVVVSTHAPEFISFTGRQKVARLQRSQGAVTLHSPTPGDVRDEIKKQERLERGRATLELPFSRFALLSEGKSDELAFRLAFKAVGFDADGASMAIIQTGGASGLAATARLAASLGIPWFAVTDADVKADGSANPMTERARKDLAALRAPKDGMATMPGKLEAALHLQAHADSAEVYDCLNGQSSDALRAAFPDFMSVVDAIVEWGSPVPKLA